MAKEPEIPVQMQALLELMAEEGIEFHVGPSKAEVLEDFFRASKLEEVAQKAQVRSWADVMEDDLEEEEEEVEEEMAEIAIRDDSLKCLITGKDIQIGDICWLLRGLGPAHLEVTLEQVQAYARSFTDG